MLIRTLFETKQFFVLRYNYNGVSIICLIDKDSGQESAMRVLNFIDGGLNNDIDGGMYFVPRYYYSDGNREYLIGMAEAYKIKTQFDKSDMKDDLKYPEKWIEFSKMANELEETDNPVIMMVRLKN